MKIDLVVFDMAGTTVRDDDAVNVCLRDALAAAGEVVSRDDVNGVMGIPKPVAIRELLVKKAGQAPAPERVSAIHEDFMQRMIRHYQTSGAGKVSEVVAHTRQVRAEGMGVISMKLVGEGAFTNREDRQAAMKFAFQNAGVDSVTVGYKNTAEIDEAIENLNLALA